MSKINFEVAIIYPQNKIFQIIMKKRFREFASKQNDSSNYIFKAHISKSGLKYSKHQIKQKIFKNFSLGKIEKCFSIFEFRLAINFFHFRLRSFGKVESRLRSHEAGVEIDTG